MALVYSHCFLSVYLLVCLGCLEARVFLAAGAPSAVSGDNLARVSNVFTRSPWPEWVPLPVYGTDSLLNYVQVMMMMIMVMIINYVQGATWLQKAPGQFIFDMGRVVPINTLQLGNGLSID